MSELIFQPRVEQENHEPLSRWVRFREDGNTSGAEIFHQDISWVPGQMPDLEIDLGSLEEVVAKLGLKGKLKLCRFYDPQESGIGIGGIGHGVATAAQVATAHKVKLSKTEYDPKKKQHNIAFNIKVMEQIVDENPEIQMAQLMNDALRKGLVELVLNDIASLDKAELERLKLILSSTIALSFVTIGAGLTGRLALGKELSNEDLGLSITIFLIMYGVFLFFESIIKNGWDEMDGWEGKNQEERHEQWQAELQNFAQKLNILPPEDSEDQEDPKLFGTVVMLHTIAKGLDHMILGLPGVRNLPRRRRTSEFFEENKTLIRNVQM